MVIRTGVVLILIYSVVILVVVELTKLAPMTSFATFTWFPGLIMAEIVLWVSYQNTDSFPKMLKKLIIISCRSQFMKFNASSEATALTFLKKGGHSRRCMCKKIKPMQFRVFILHRIFTKI